MSILSALHDPKLAGRVRGALWQLRGVPVYGSSSPTTGDMIKAGLLRELRYLEKRYNKGRPFVGSANPGGRPRKLG
jgi:hypothetical protein